MVSSFGHYLELLETFNGVKMAGIVMYPTFFEVFQTIIEISSREQCIIDPVKVVLKHSKIHISYIYVGQPIFLDGLDYQSV